MTCAPAVAPTVAQLDPVLHPGYSPMLFHYLRGAVDHTSAKVPYDVYRGPPIGGETASKLCMGYLLSDTFHGIMLMSLLQGELPGVLSLPAEQVVLVEDFWQQYIQVGRCAADPEHRLVDAGYGGGRVLLSRGNPGCFTCMNCGAHVERAGAF